MKAPKRRIVLTIEIGADTLEDALSQLDHLSLNLPKTDAELPQPYTGIMGGSAMNHIVTIVKDESMTHERYVAELEAYLAEQDKLKGAPCRHHQHAVFVDVATRKCTECGEVLP